MIGWIALAGIIVRNSILLVDFSIHEVQKGVPVAEAVIRACKTRTRPIVITALALVAGSSVIFTDPIFQGMAISLASGVLVSTVLTLIVIPLGCVAASKDLCEVAAATAPAGTSVPCATAAAKEEPKVEQEPKQKEPRSGPGILAKIWGYLTEGIILGFYLIRGLFLLLYDFLKGLVKKQQPTPRPPATPDAGGRDLAGGSDAPPVTSASGSDTAAPVSTPSDSPAAATEQAPSTPAETASVPRTEETDTLTVREEVSGVESRKDAEALEQGPRQDAPEVHTEQQAGTSSGAPQAAGGATPATDAKPTATTDAASDTAEERVSKPQTDPTVTTEQDDASAAQKETTGKATADDTRKEPAAAKKPVAKKTPAKPKTTKPAAVRKKPRRRGIRLKADDEL